MTMRDFEQDRMICEAATPAPWRVDSHGEIFQTKHITRDVWHIPRTQEDTAFIAAAREGWPAALDEIESLKRQLRMAAKEAAKGCCPYDANKAFALICKEDCSDDDTRSERCWLEYWRQKAGGVK